MKLFLLSKWPYFDGAICSGDLRVAASNFMGLQIDWQLLESQANNIAERTQKQFRSTNVRKGFVTLDKEPTKDTFHTDISGLLAEHP